MRLNVLVSLKIMYHSPEFGMSPFTITQEVSNGVIKPKACRPTLNSSIINCHFKANSNTCINNKATRDEGYNSQNISSSSAITSSSSASSNGSNYFNEKYETETDANAHSTRKIRPRPRSSTAASIGYKKLIEDSLVKISNRLSVYNQDNNLQDKNFHCVPTTAEQPKSQCNKFCNSNLKKIIDDKENELNKLREKIESNEKTICTLHEQKEKELKKQISEIEEQWLEKLKIHQQKSFKLEQSLLVQILQLKNENNDLNEKLFQLQNDVQLLKIEKEEANNTVHQLKHHLEETHIQTSKKLDAIVSLKSHSYTSCNENVYETIFSVDNSIISPIPSFIKKKNKFGLKKESYEYGGGNNKRNYDEHENSDQTAQTDDSASTLQEVISQMEELKKLNQLQHNSWLNEKNRVIDYQKKLQANYLNVCQENRLLKDEISKLKNYNEKKTLFDSIATESFC
ncbi:hypothetical protein HELRODRAFT_162826 [Helobdella robusta]|uniref:Uncharacterized protein n=1 Tax=Helobdella robusta TaxID=6412 RepID=T1ET82_HELRO|nr:hypothetical protein HELRODRAFT_162826 [Helobdella robusta]ESN99306.1 hypothetical protein HELRODRAFT_162826 [Helobdella robusta]